jgi:hypothetical protein
MEQRLDLLGIANHFDGEELKPLAKSYVRKMEAVSDTWVS